MTSKLTLLLMVPKISLLPPNHNPYPQSLVDEANCLLLWGMWDTPVLFSPHPPNGVSERSNFCLAVTGKGLKEDALLRGSLSGGRDSRGWDEPMGWGQWNRLGEDGMDKWTGWCG